MKIKILQAGNGDCFIVSFHDSEHNCSRNILIDSGIADTYYSQNSNIDGDLKIELDYIREKGESIDLLILTHIDNDHICGLLKWFEVDNKAYELIKNVWFNSGRLIASYFNEPENKNLSVGLKIFTNTQTGVHEAIEFENYLIDKNIWDQKLLIEGQEIEEASVKIQILSPNEAQIKKLLKEYKEKSIDSVYTFGKRKDWDNDLKSFIAEEESPDFRFNQDNSAKNGSSISFILTVKNKRFLFLADSHPRGIVKQLNRFGFSEDNPLQVEIMKISHHGSKANTCKKLLQIVKTDNYIISTDSSGQYHPNKRTLARIINVNPNAVFHFNYEHVRNAMFSDKDRKDYSIKAKVTKELEY